jgi:hypothetical protein
VPLEGDDDGCRVTQTGAANDLTDDGEMTAVHAVECADGDDAAPVTEYRTYRIAGRRRDDVHVVSR